MGPSPEDEWLVSQKGDFLKPWLLEKRALDHESLWIQWTWPEQNPLIMTRVIKLPILGWLNNANKYGNF